MDRIFSEQVELPYTPRQMFDLVSDIESYPKFLPHLASAKIMRRNGNTLLVDQVVVIKLLRLRFSTRAELDPPHGITVVCADSPFGAFTDHWTFAESPAGGTRLRCRTAFAFRSKVLEFTLGGAVGEVLKATVAAFERRARVLYGGPIVPRAAMPGV